MLSAGLAGVGVGLLLMGGIDAGDEWTTLLGGFLVAGAGVGLLNPVIADVAVSVVPKEQSGMAAGINDTFRQVGRRGRHRRLGRDLRRPRRRQGHRADRGDVRGGRATAPRAGRGRLVGQPRPGRLARCPPGTRQATADAAHEGFLAGLNEVLTLGALVSFAGAALALWLVRERDIERAPLELVDADPEAGSVPEAAAA